MRMLLHYIQSWTTITNSFMYNIYQQNETVFCGRIYIYPNIKFVNRESNQPDDNYTQCIINIWYISITSRHWRWETLTPCNNDVFTHHTDTLLTVSVWFDLRFFSLPHSPILVIIEDKIYKKKKKYEWNYYIIRIHA